MKTLKSGMAGARQELPLYPNRRGVYVLTDEDDHVLYVGRSKQLCRRVSHLTAMQHDATNPQNLSHIKAGLVRQQQEAGHPVFVHFIETDADAAVAKDLIETYRPPWNNG